MLAKAVQDHNPGLPGLKGTTLSQHYKANALKPSLASSLNTIQSTHSTASNPLKRTASQANGRSPFSSQDQGLKRSLTDTARASAGGGRVEKLHDTVFFDENDFQDDADVDLDEETLPLSREHSDTLLPDPVPKKTTTPQTPVNSTPLPWSSSPLAHHNVPPPKLQTTTATNANMTKRRTLPWLDQNHVAREEEADRETPRRKITDGLCEDLTGAVPISSQQARLAKDKKQRARYLGKEQVDKQCVELNGTGLPGRTIHDFKNQGIPDSVVGNIIQGRETRAALEANGEDRPRNTNRYTLPGLVVEKIVQRKEEKATSKAIGNDYTPLPKDNVNSPYPWNKTASAVKEEQRKLRQGHKKLVKDLENQAEQSKLKRKRESVARPFLSDEQRSVLKLVAEQQKSVFFTGSAGTGKSVLLRETIKVLRDRYKREPDRVAVTASTGLAACNVGGVTLHSFAGIGLGKEAIPELVKKIKRNQKTKSRWMRTKVLIIDEISMVDGDLFDKLEGIARAIRNNGRPFGGIQLVITGDFFQLPPVPDQGKIAKFSFDAATWNTSIEHTIGLTQVFRQKDPVFANMLNEMRLGKLTPSSINAFQALNRPLGFQDDFEATELFSTRAEVDNANNARMRNLSGKEVEFKAEDGGSILEPAYREKLLSNCMAPPVISLKKGAQVMLIKNIDDTLVNGSVGKVIAFMDEKTFDIYHEDEEEFQAVETMEFHDDEMTKSRKKLKAMINKDLAGDTSQKWPLVRFAVADGTSRDLLCQRESWKIELPNGEVQASRSQIPLILAWALSIHKAQGQTLDRVKVDLGKIFEKGQAYVALSRATCQEGLQISRFDPKKVMAHDRVRTFYDSLYSINQATGSNGRRGVTKQDTSAVKHKSNFVDPVDAFDEDHDEDHDAEQAMMQR